MKKILSIHSSVMIGFVGNSVAAPVLTALGQQPLTIDTVTLPAHPGYGLSGGGPVPAKQIGDFIKAIHQLDQFADIAHIITGYMGSQDQVDVIAAGIAQWAKIQPDGVYVFDPVLGDNDQLYINPALASAMISRLLPLASIVTPNQFELGYLSGTAVTSTKSAIAAAQSLLDAQPDLQLVLATGIENGSDRGDLLVQRWTEPLWQPALAEGKNVSGGGDFLTALFTGFLAKGLAVPHAFVKASTYTQRVLAASTTSRELALYQNLNALAD